MKAALNAFRGCLAALPAKFGRAAMRTEREIAKPVGVGVSGERSKDSRLISEISSISISLSCFGKLSWYMLVLDTSVSC